MSAESTAAQEVADQRRFRAYTGNVLGLATVIANNVDIDRLDGRMRDPDSKELMTQAISHALRLDLENPFQKDPADIVAQAREAEDRCFMADAPFETLPYATRWGNYRPVIPLGELDECRDLLEDLFQRAYNQYHG